MKKYHRLDWDLRSIYHIAKHYVTADEVQQVIFSSHFRIRRGKGEDIYYVFGQTEVGRYLFIVLRDMSGGIGNVVTTRDMSEHEKRWYNQ